MSAIIHLTDGLGTWPGAFPPGQPLVGDTFRDWNNGERFRVLSRDWDEHGQLHVDVERVKPTVDPGEKEGP